MGFGIIYYKISVYEIKISGYQCIKLIKFLQQIMNAPSNSKFLSTNELLQVCCTMSNKTNRGKMILLFNI